MDIDIKLDMYLNEIFKKVIRAGKMKRKTICPVPGMKAEKGKCVMMSPSEKRKRQKAAIKRGRILKTKKGLQAKAAKKRAKSMKKRAMGIPQKGAPSMEFTNDKEKKFS